jgi:hypothetical protein
MNVPLPHILLLTAHRNVSDKIEGGLIFMQTLRETRIGELGTKLSNFVFLRSVRRLLVTANVPSSPILVTLMMEALSSFETSVLTRATRRKNPEDSILQIFHASGIHSISEEWCLLGCYAVWLL